MTFAAIPNPISALVFDTNNPSESLGTVTTTRNISLSRMVLHFYLQGTSTARVRFYVVVSGTTYYTEWGELSEVTANTIGRMGLNMVVRPNLTNAVAYTFGVELSSYVPTVGDDYNSAAFFSLLRDYPVAMAYSTPTAVFSSPLAITLFESV